MEEIRAFIIKNDLHITDVSNIAQLKSWEEDTSFTNDLKRSHSHNALYPTTDP